MSSFVNTFLHTVHTIASVATALILLITNHTRTRKNWILESASSAGPSIIKSLRNMLNCSETGYSKSSVSFYGVYGCIFRYCCIKSQIFQVFFTLSFMFSFTCAGVGAGAGVCSDSASCATTILVNLHSALTSSLCNTMTTTLQPTYAWVVVEPQHTVYTSYFFASIVSTTRNAQSTTFHNLLSVREFL